MPIGTARPAFRLGWSFATKPALAAEIITHVLDASVKAAGRQVTRSTAPTRHCANSSAPRLRGSGGY
jgi:hypothetical protein